MLGLLTVAVVLVAGLFVSRLRQAPQQTPLLPLQLERMSDREVEAVVVKEVPLGSSPSQTKEWLDRRKLVINFWAETSLEKAGRIETRLPAMEPVRPGFGQRLLIFHFDNGAAMTRAFVTYKVF